MSVAMLARDQVDAPRATRRRLKGEKGYLEGWNRAAVCREERSESGGFRVTRPLI